jgi:hypothetical protein
MEEKDEHKHKCPLFTDMVCPKGQAASQACSVRVNGDFDPMQYFKDRLIVNCAIHRNQKRLANESEK